MEEISSVIPPPQVNNFWAGVHAHILICSILTFTFIWGNSKFNEFQIAFICMVRVIVTAVWSLIWPPEFFVITDSFGVIRVKFQRIGVKCNSVLKINQTNHVIIIHSAYLGSGASKSFILRIEYGYNIWLTSFKISSFSVFFNNTIG